MRYLTPRFDSLQRKLHETAPGGLIVIPPHGLPGSPQDWCYPASDDGVLRVQVGTDLFALTDSGDFVLTYTGVPNDEDTSVVVSEQGIPFVHNAKTCMLHAYRGDGSIDFAGSVPSTPWSPLGYRLIYYVGPVQEGGSGLWLFNVRDDTRTMVASGYDRIVGIGNPHVYVFSESVWKLTGISVTGNMVYESRCPSAISPKHIFITPLENRVLYVREDLDGVTILSDSESGTEGRMANLRADNFIGVHRHGLWIEKDGMFGLLIV